jgi:glutamate-1-semialdehyde 2,1-aminomutase
MPLIDRARDVLIDGCNTFSKRIESYVEGITDSHVVNGSGKYLMMTSNGREMQEKFDLVGGLGSNLWQCENNYSLECMDAIMLAEELRVRMPYHTKYKFVKSGSDACSAAIRYARAFSGRSHIAYTGYHGWHNAFISCTPPAVGCVPEHSTKFDTIEELTSFVESKPSLAAVIVEPLELQLDGIMDRLLLLKALCVEDGCLLIFDEVITGWRVPKFTVANMVGVYPHISCLGKAIGGGYPLGIVATSDDFLVPGVFVSSTFGGEQSALRAALSLVRTTSTCDIEKTWDLGMQFQSRVNILAPGVCRLDGYPTRFVWVCDSDETKAKIWQSLYLRGYLAGGAFFPKLSWTEADFANIYEAIKGSIEDIDKTVLMGIPPRPVFRRNR